MIIKSLIATAAVAASLTVLAPVEKAEARVNVDINLGLGGGYYPDYGYGGYYPVIDPGFGGGYGDDYGGISCHKGKKIVRWAGFRNVQPINCSAPVYKYKAWKFGNPYRVKVNIHGDIIQVKPLF